MNKSLILFMCLALCLVSCKEPSETPQQPQPVQESYPKGIDTTAYTYNGESHNAKKEFEYIDTSQPFVVHKVTPNKKAGAPFNTLDYDVVVAYDYEGGPEGDSHIILQNGRLHPNILKRVSLSQEQVTKITTLLSENETYGNGVSACFVPRFGLVFYKGENVVQHISICLECNRLHSSKIIPATHVKKLYEGTENEIPLEGFSKTGGHAIDVFAKSLGFR